MLEEIVPLTPIHFFAFQIECFSFQKELNKHHILPDLTSFQGDFPHAVVLLGWNELGLAAEVRAVHPFEESEFPNFGSGDSVEFFIDTRDVKTSAFTTKFCHHFYFLPRPVDENGESIQAAEVSRFRGEESHELCDPSKLTVVTEKKKTEIVMKIFIPAECLYGYDPQQLDRLGFTYRINRKDGSKQFFSGNDADFNIENQPSLWATLLLIKE